MGDLHPPRFFILPRKAVLVYPLGRWAYVIILLKSEVGHLSSGIRSTGMPKKVRRQKPRVASMAARTITTRNCPTGAPTIYVMKRTLMTQSSSKTRVARSSPFRQVMSTSEASSADTRARSQR